MYTKQFWRAALERALKTFVQTLLGTPFGVALIGIATDPSSVDLVLLQRLWLLALTSLIAAVAAGLLSILWSLFNARKDGNPSATNAERLNLGTRSDRLTSGPQGW